MTIPNKLNILIATGEVSGDLYGSMLVGELKKIFNDPVIYAVGSDHLQKAGAQIVYDSVKYSSVGLVESLKQGKNILKMMDEIKRFISSTPLDIAIMIDNQGVNMPLIDYIHRISPKTKVYYFIPPQEWIWGTQKGGKEVLDKLNKIFCIYEKEYEFYSALEPSKTTYVGHPLINLIKEEKNKYIAQGKIVKNNLVGFFPGSRESEEWGRKTAGRAYCAAGRAIFPNFQRKGCGAAPGSACTSVPPSPCGDSS